jgi:hypothetical protein
VHPDARSAFQRVGRAQLKHFPAFCVVLVTIPQVRGAEFPERFRSAWDECLILPVAGKLLRWPGGDLR